VQFPSEAAKLQIVSADPHLNKLLSKYCDEVLAARKVPPVPLRVNVENLIATLLPHGQARRDVVAQKLGLSPRSLGRKLSAEGISFARILEELRIGLAKRYLSERDLSISRIAWLLGYTEVSAFSHAFRRWTGRAPRADRSWRRSPSPVLTRKGRTPVLE
jgi:AraC-like DNA-binding protein